MSVFNIPVITSMIGQITTSSGSCISVSSSQLDIGSGTSNSSDVWAYGLYDYSWYSAIWLQSELGTTKQITGLEVDLRSYTTPYTYDNMSIELAHTTDDIFDDTPAVDWSDMVINDQLTVLTFDMVITSNGYQTITFDNNFCYNGTDNLIIRVRNNKGDWDSGFGRGYYDFSPAISRAAYKAEDDNYPTGNGQRTNNRVNIKFKY